MSTSGELKQQFEVNDNYNMSSIHSESALELKKLLSPEKALDILYNLVDTHPRLWLDIYNILYPQNPREISHKFDNKENLNIITSSPRKQNKRKEFEPPIKEIKNSIIDNILKQLRGLQLSELPLDNLSMIISYLTSKDALKFSETSSFFFHTVPKYINAIHLESHPKHGNLQINESIYNLFYKSERLRYLNINGRKNWEDAVIFLFPFSKFKSLYELNLDHVKFINTNNVEIETATKYDHDINEYKFDGGTYSLQQLELTECINLEIDNWLKLTSNTHSPNLKSIKIYPTRRSQPVDNTMDKFLSSLYKSSDHYQIHELYTVMHDIEMMKNLRMNRFMINNLKRLDIGLIDRASEEDTTCNISLLFQELFISDKYTNNTDNNENYHVFENLQILCIDFCANDYTRGYNDISPIDLHNFVNSIPFIFPSLQLLGLYGSRAPLLFNDHHLNGLLENKQVPQIIDLSIGFDDLSEEVCDNLAERILNTFPNLAWLTIENEQIICEPEQFIKNVESNIINPNNLQWVTLCSSEQDEIRELSNGIFIEFWDRAVEQCQFDVALARSQQIVSYGKHRKSVINSPQIDPKSVPLPELPPNQSISEEKDLEQQNIDFEFDMEQIL